MPSLIFFKGSLYEFSKSFVLENSFQIDTFDFFKMSSGSLFLQNFIEKQTIRIRKIKEKIPTTTPIIIEPIYDSVWGGLRTYFQAGIVGFMSVVDSVKGSDEIQLV